MVLEETLLRDISSPSLFFRVQTPEVIIIYFLFSNGLELYI